MHMKNQIILIQVFASAILFSCGNIDKNTITKISKYDMHVDIPPVHQKTEGKIANSKNNDRLKLLNAEKDDFITIHETKQEGIQSPAPQFDVPNNHFEIDAATGGTFTYEKTGSTVTIPSDGLVDKNGNPVTGKVDISYREFHTPKEVFFSGIPMHYDLDGERQYFESAGMLEIKASQNNEEVFVKEGKTIQFKMSTDNTHEEVLLYELDSQKKEWKEKSTAPVINTPLNITKKWGPIYKTEENKKTSRTPLHIYIKNYEAKYDPVSKTRHFKLQFKMNVTRLNKSKNKTNKKDFDNAVIFNNAIFEVEGIRKNTFLKLIRTLKRKRNKDKKDVVFYGVMADVNITNINDPYLTLEMSYEGEKVVLDVKVMHQFSKSKRTNKKIFDAVSQFPINDFAGRYSNQREFITCIDRYDSISPYSIGEDWGNKYLIQREFESKNFGVLNCDQPHKLPKEMVANAHFYIGNQEVHPNFAVLADCKKKCLYTYYNWGLNRFGFNPESKNFIFTILEDGTVGFIMPGDFKEIQQGGYLKIPMQRVTMDDFDKVMEDLFPAKGQGSYQI